MKYGLLTYRPGCHCGVVGPINDLPTAKAQQETVCRNQIGTSVYIVPLDDSGKVASVVVTDTPKE